MRIIIKLADKREIEAELKEKEYELLKEELIRGRIKFLCFENQLLKASFIESIEKVLDPISGLRLPEPSKPEKINIDKQMERLFNLLKSKGLFKEYENYQDWQKQKRARVEPV